MSAYREFDPTPFLGIPEPAGDAAKVAKPAKVHGGQGSTLATLAALAGRSLNPQPPPADCALEWRRLLNLLAQHKEDLGHSPEFAARLAYGEIMTALHLQSGETPDPSRC